MVSSGHHRSDGDTVCHIHAKTSWIANRTYFNVMVWCPIHICDVCNLWFLSKYKTSGERQHHQPDNIRAIQLNLRRNDHWLMVAQWPWRHWTWSTLVQVMVCCQAAPTHYLDQCWLIISKVLWHSHDSNFTANAHDLYTWYELGNY